MASVKFEKGSKEWYMFQDYWKLCQKFWIPEDSDKYWEDVIREVGKFYKKYENIFAKKIVIALVDSLEKKDRERRNSG